MKHGRALTADMSEHPVAYVSDMSADTSHLCKTVASLADFAAMCPRLAQYSHHNAYVAMSCMSSSAA